MKQLVPSFTLAAAARRELALREQLWPREIAGGRATSADEAADLAVWRDLLAWAEGSRIELLTPARAEQLAAALVEAEGRRWKGLVPDTDDRHTARSQRLLDTNALAHAFECWRIRQGWARHPARELPGFDEAA